MNLFGYTICKSKELERLNLRIDALNKSIDNLRSDVDTQSINVEATLIWFKNNIQDLESKIVRKKK